MPSKDFPQTHSGMSDALTFVESEVRQLAGVDERMLDRVVLVAGEVLANAVEHGGTAPQQAVRIEVSGSASAIELAIREGSESVRLDRFEDARLPSNTLATEGRGLFLIRSLSDHIDANGPRGLRFRFEPRHAS